MTDEQQRRQVWIDECARSLRNGCGYELAMSNADSMLALFDKRFPAERGRLPDVPDARLASWNLAPCPGWKVVDSKEDGLWRTITVERESPQTYQWPDLAANSYFPAEAVYALYQKQQDDAEHLQNLTALAEAQAAVEQAAEAPELPNSVFEIDGLPPFPEGVKWHMQGVEIQVHPGAVEKLAQAGKPAETEADRMWRASKSFKGD